MKHVVLCLKDAKLAGILCFGNSSFTVFANHREVALWQSWGVWGPRQLWSPPEGHAEGPDYEHITGPQNIGPSRFILTT